MHETIKQLLSLQERDLALDTLSKELSAIPVQIDAIKKQIADNKAALEAAKKELTQFQLQKKEKEVDLESKEGAIRKHSGELNAVKTNEAYRALLGEIEKAKSEKSAAEDAILQLMEQIDQANKIWKEKETVSKGTESGYLAKISEWETKQKVVEADLAQKKTDRDQFATTLSKALAEQYERIRARNKSAAVVPLKNEQCSGCHMKVAQNLINEVRRGQKLMVCENCSRIVFLEEAIAPAQ